MRATFSLICIMFQALCEIDIQEVGGTSYSTVLGGVNYRRAKTTTYRQHCPRFKFPSSGNASGKYTQTGY